MEAEYSIAETIRHIQVWKRGGRMNPIEVAQSAAYWLGKSRPMAVRPGGDSLPAHTLAGTVAQLLAWLDNEAPDLPETVALSALFWLQHSKISDDPTVRVDERFEPKKGARIAEAAELMEQVDAELEEARKNTSGRLMTAQERQLWRAAFAVAYDRAAWAEDQLQRGMYAAQAATKAVHAARLVAAVDPKLYPAGEVVAARDAMGVERG